MKQLIPFICLCSLPFLFNGCETKEELIQDGDSWVEKIKSEVVGISPEEAWEIMDTADFYLVDVRLTEDYQKGFIPEAVNIPRGMLEFIIDLNAFWESQYLLAPDRDELIILYCKKGKRSILAARVLQQMGYEKVSYIEGGYKNWEKNYPDDFERMEVEDSVAARLENLCGC